MRLQVVVGLTKPQQVVLPAEAHIPNSRESLIEPMSSQRVWKNGNDYSHDGYLEQPRVSTSEEKIRQARDRLSPRDFIDSTHNYQPRHVIHQIPGQISRSVESKTFETCEFKDAFTLSHNRSSNQLDDSVKYDRGLDLEPRVIHVNGANEAYNSKRRRVEDLTPVSSDKYWQHNIRSHPDRTVLVPYGRADDWGDSHKQLSPVTPLSTMNPFIRRDPKVYVQPVEVTRHVDREMVAREIPHEASSSNRGPIRAFRSAEALQPSSHSVRNLPADSQQAGHDSFFAAPGKASSVSSVRDEHMRLQTSHVPFTSSISSCDAYDHPPYEFSKRRCIVPLEHRGTDRQQYEHDLHSDFALLDTGSRYDSENSKLSIEGLETHRGTLVPKIRDRSPTPVRREARTCIFLRELPDGKYTTSDNARLSSSRTRRIHEVNNSPRSDSDRFLSSGARSRVTQTWTPVREKVHFDSWQPNSGLAIDQRYVIYCISSKPQT